MRAPRLAMARRAFLLTGLAACARPPAAPVGLALPPRFADSAPTDWPGAGPAAYRVHGVDVARFQPALDWDRARAAGVNFAFVKAT